jgi:CheY-like chemotaxis protein
MTRRILIGEGFDVLTAIDGVDALQVLASVRVDAVLSDLKMPRMDGHELAATIMRRWPDVRVLFMTGYPSAALIGGLPGPVVMKPFSSENLLAAVHEVFGSR